MNTEAHMLYSLRNAPVKPWPFPHFYAENVFPPDFYQDLLKFVRAKSDYSASEYGNRQFAVDSTIPGLEFLESPDFLKNILSIFAPQVQETFGTNAIKVSREVRLIRDCQNYKIGPHTDAAWKLVSLLFYLPDTFAYRDYGTSIFVPRDRTFVCEGGPHYRFDPFDKVYTAPYLPNTCFGFWKTNHSFHGVEPIPIQFDRDVLLFNIYKQKPHK
jgi:hypothetical protein